MNGEELLNKALFGNSRTKEDKNKKEWENRAIDKNKVK